MANAKHINQYMKCIILMNCIKYNGMEEDTFYSGLSVGTRVEKGPILPVQLSLHLACDIYHVERVKRAWQLLMKIQSFNVSEHLQIALQYWKYEISEVCVTVVTYL